jgi:translation initiation factor IF-2
VVGFNVSCPKEVYSLSLSYPTAVQIHIDKVIYRLVDIVKDSVAKILPKQYGTKVEAEAEILQIFMINVKRKKQVPIAGCKVLEGNFTKNGKVRIMREKEIIYDGKHTHLLDASKTKDRCRKVRSRCSDTSRTKFKKSRRGANVE